MPRVTWTYNEYLTHDGDIKCEECGECDCRASGWSLELCAIAGVCGGMHYDVYVGSDGTTLCNECYDNRPDKGHDWDDYDPYPYPGKMTKICVRCELTMENVEDMEECHA